MNSIILSEHSYFILRLAAVPSLNKAWRDLMHFYEVVLGVFEEEFLINPSSSLADKLEELRRLAREIDMTFEWALDTKNNEAYADVLIEATGFWHELDFFQKWYLRQDLD